MTDSNSEKPLSDGLIEAFSGIVGRKFALHAVDDISSFVEDPRGLLSSTSPLVLRPANVEEISEILKLATKTKTPIVPQGGNTGLVCGQLPSVSDQQVIVSLSRLNKIREVDLENNVMVVEAGAILANVQEHARKFDRLFPLSLGSEGSCQIGGNLATNAGGTNVLAYGNMRDLCLGVEVVLPTGEVLNGLRKLKKDNTGYSLRDLFIGSEGTLGIITAAVLKLYPQPKSEEVIVAGVLSPNHALKLFWLTQRTFGANLTAFEIMPRAGVVASVKNLGDVREPLASEHEWYVLLEISSQEPPAHTRNQVEALFMEALEKELLEDAVISTSDSQRMELWHMREGMPDALNTEAVSIKHDISVPTSRIPDFIRHADALVQCQMPDAVICAFGHMGDGNVHYNILQPPSLGKAAFLGATRDINNAVHGVALEFGGSISAEHGIGQLKRDELSRVRQPIEIELMKRIKSSFDPAGIMNQGKLI